MELSFGKVSVPLDDYAIQGNAVLGIRESGKSYTSTYAGERLMDAGIPITAVDPIGIWHSLRIPAQGPGYPVVVVGGQHGDLPLTPASAEHTMRAAMAAGVSVVFDLYDVKLSKRDWRDIVVAIVKVLLFENKDHGLRHVFIEEAPEFVPQKVGPDQGVVYSYVERLVRMGGNAQLGVTLIGQRAEEMNKAVLELCDCLVLHRQKGRRSLENLSKWLELASPATAKEVSAAVPLLKNGEALVWPRGNEGPIRTQVPEKRTFHPDRRTRHKAVAAEAKRMDAGEFVAKMKAELEKAKAPLAALPAARALIERDVRADFSQQALAEYKRGYTEGELEGVVKGRAEALKIFRELAHEAKRQVHMALGQANIAIGKVDTLVEMIENVEKAAWSASVVSRPEVKAAQRTMNAAAREAVTIVGCPLDRPQRLILNALRQYHPEPLEKARVAILTRYAQKGGGFRNALSALRTQGLITHGEPIELTEAGAQAIAPYFQPLPTGTELIEHWKQRLDKPGRLILEAVVTAYPKALTKGQVAHAAGYEPAGGGFRNALSRLRTLELVKGYRDIRASEALFA